MCELHIFIFLLLFVTLFCFPLLVSLRVCYCTFKSFATRQNAQEGVVAHSTLVKGRWRAIASIEIMVISLNFPALQTYISKVFNISVIFTVSAGVWSW